MAKIYFYKDGGSAAIEFTPQVLENLQHKCIRFINYKRLKSTSAKKFTARARSASAVNFLARVM